jgi:hypothetical protein
MQNGGGDEHRVVDLDVGRAFRSRPSDVGVSHITPASVVREQRSPTALSSSTRPGALYASRTTAVTVEPSSPR